MGFPCESSWLDMAHDYPVPKDDALLGTKVDIFEIEQAELFLLDTLDENNTGGREVELGIALHRNIQIWRIGPVRNVYHYRCQREFTDWEEALTTLKDYVYER